jgi:sugar phosphate isomerase/epimerase
MKKSIGDSIFPRELTFAQGLQLLKRAGYQGVELWLGDRPWFQMGTTDAQLRQLFSQIQNAGLEVSNVSNALDWDENICARDPAKRQAAFHHIERQTCLITRFTPAALTL